MLKSFLKKHDMFGQIVKINYDSKRKTHSTLLGGILTVIVRTSLFSLILIKLIIMLTKGNNSITSYSSAFNVDDGDGVDIKKLEMTNYHIIRK